MAVQCNRSSRFAILYHEEIDIDGLDCRREFSSLIRKTGHKLFYDRAHEWCCGHGAIGFQLLEDGLCRHLVLTDKHAKAIQDCQYTVAVNDLQNSVSCYNLESLGDLPESEKWDLFLANPPWRKEVQPGPVLDDDLLRKMFDIDWCTHENMWQNIGSYLAPGADVYIYEDSRFSDPSTWKDGIKKSGLELKKTYSPFGILKTGYVMHLQKT